MKIKLIIPLAIVACTANPCIFAEPKTQDKSTKQVSQTEDTERARANLSISQEGIESHMRTGHRHGRTALARERILKEKR